MYLSLDGAIKNVMTSGHPAISSNPRAATVTSKSFGQNVHEISLHGSGKALSHDMKKAAAISLG